MEESLDIKDYIKEKLISSISKSGFDVKNILFEKPREEKFGDITTNVAMQIAKACPRVGGEQKKKPFEIAKTIIENLEVDSSLISKTEIAGAGFINFFIGENYYKEKLKPILELAQNYGRHEINKGKTANIEWVSANPTGPLHTGHGRHVALGKSIANLLEWSGYKVTREYYYNNAGRQMENLAKSVYSRYRQMFEPDFPFPEDGYVGDYVKEIALIMKDEHGDKLIDSDDSIFKKAGENWCFKSIRQTLHHLGIEHDVFYNESSLYESKKIDETVEEFKKKNLSYEKDGAVWIKTSELIKDNPSADGQDKVIVKSTGEPTYRLPDMAYHADKIKRGYDLIVDIFGADHGDTYKEVLAGVQGLGYDTSKIKVIIHQMVTFVQDGKPVKMSKRSDNVYTLDELLDDIGADVAQFFFVMRSANTHLDFDVALAKEQSEKNPVFYLQYAHARICSILRNAKEVFPDYANYESGDFDVSLIKEKDEVELLKSLNEFPEIVASAYFTLEPHKVINYLNEVAERYHRFYHNNRVINKDNEKLSLVRIKICEAAKIVLRNGFDIIGISAPEKM